MIEFLSPGISFPLPLGGQQEAGRDILVPSLGPRPFPPPTMETHGGDQTQRPGQPSALLLGKGCGIIPSC